MHAPSWEVKEIAEKTWCIEGFDVGANMYLIAGNERAILIDNGYGEHDPRPVAESLCGLPVRWTALTHGHFDHAGGSRFFELVYMSPAAEKQAKEPYPSLAGRIYDFRYPIRFVANGDRIDLGGRVLEVIDIPSHAPGDVAYLDRSGRLLFGGDAVGSHVNLTEATVAQYREHLKALLARCGEFDRVCVGHGPRPEGIECIENMLENAERILSGIEGEAPGPRKMDGPPGKGPRPQDAPKEDPQYKRESQWKHTSLGYDTRKIR